MYEVLILDGMIALTALAVYLSRVLDKRKDFKRLEETGIVPRTANKRVIARFQAHPEKYLEIQAWNEHEAALRDELYNTMKSKFAAEFGAGNFRNGKVIKDGK